MGVWLSCGVGRGGGGGTSTDEEQGEGDCLYGSKVWIDAQRVVDGAHISQVEPCRRMLSGAWAGAYMYLQKEALHLREEET